VCYTAPVSDSTKIKSLSALNVSAIQECFPDVSTTATTATFPHSASVAAQMVLDKISSLPGRSHPKASLWAVHRKLLAQVPPVAADDPRLAELTPSKPKLDEIEVVVTDLKQGYVLYKGNSEGDAALTALDFLKLNPRAEGVKIVVGNEWAYPIIVSGPEYYGEASDPLPRLPDLAYRITQKKQELAQ
jgi:hypothetical protein